MKLAPHVRPLCGLLSMTTLAVWLFGPASAFGGVFDDAKFKLDLRGDANGNDTLDQGEIGNAFDFSAASPSYAFYGEKGVAKPYTCDYYPSQTVMRVALPLSAGKTNEQTCIYFPQEPASKYCGITISKAAVTGDNITMYTRFRPDGLTSSPNGVMLNGFNGYSASGLGLYLDGEYKIGILTPGTMGSSSVKLTRGEWYDVFVVATNSTDGSSTGINIYACKNGSSSFTTATIKRTGNYVMAIVAGRALTFGSFESNTPSNPRAFKGAIAEAAIWDRVLTEDEMLEVMAGLPPSLGGEWQIGAANGSADEFDDADPADVYDVQSMPWRRMRKTLDSANPSLSISTTMASGDHQMARTLTVTPILSGATSAPVEVALNGTVVGEIDLATTTSITLPRKLWRHDGGANTIAVTRTAPVSGTVQLDAVSLAPAATQTAGTVLEDATFKLDLRGGESTYTQPGVLGNALDFSAASPLAGYMGDQRGPQTYNANFGNLPAQETADVQNPYYPYTTNSQTVLHFYQDFKGEDKGSVNSGVVIPGAAPKGLVQTYYLRFRWDGEAPAKTGGDDKSAPVYILQSGQSSNGNNVNNGVAINLNGITVKGTTTNAVLACRVGASGTSRYPEMTATISAGKWVDAFVTFEANADNTGFTTTFSVCSPSPTTGGNFNPPSLVTQVVSSSGGLSFDSTNLSLGLYHESANTRSTTRCFRGLIADFMTWERALTDAEKIEVMSGRHGAKWTIGAANGSAEEFTDDDPAAVFEPESMPWRRMRRTLTAANPALSLQSPLAAHEAGRAMLFTLVPVPDGAAHPVRVAVNGTVVGDFDAATDGTIVIPRGSWTRDGSGDVTVTATSLNTSAPLSIDAIALSGSWQNAPDGGGSNGMLNEKYSPRVAFAGDTDVDHFTSSMSVGNSSTNYTFGVWVPKGMGDKVGWKFRTKTTSLSNPIDGLDARHVVYVNGTAVGLHDGWFEENEAFTLDIPAGVLHDGMNYVQWVQTLPTREAQQALVGRPGVFQYYDYWGMTLVPPQSPFMIVVR